VALIVNNEIKSEKIGARVTPEQKKVVHNQMKKLGYKRESEYVLACCLQGTDVRMISYSKVENLEDSKSLTIKARITEQERKDILLRFNKSGLTSFSKFIRNCCMENPIISIDGMKELSLELNKIGNNLNQITMLCHQGLISNPDIDETVNILKKIYKELYDIKVKNRLRR
jgi:hypothetical protein